MRRKNLHADRRALQWRGEQGNSATLTPIAAADPRPTAHARRAARRSRSASQPAPYDHQRRPTPTAASRWLRADRPVAPPPGRRRAGSSGAATAGESQHPRAARCATSSMPATCCWPHGRRQHATSATACAERAAQVHPQLLDERPQPGRRRRGRDAAAQRDAHHAAQRRAAARRLRRERRRVQTRASPPTRRTNGTSTPQLGRARRPALGGHHDPRHRRRRRAPSNRSSVLDAAAARGVEARPEGPRPGAHQPDAQLPLADAAEPDRPAEHQQPLPGARRATRRPSPTAPATPTCGPSSPPASTSRSSATCRRRRCSAPTCSTARSATTCAA